MIDLNVRSPLDERQKRIDSRAYANKLRVAVPGIIESFDPGEQTVTVRVAIREKVLLDGDEKWVNIPLLLDVPIIIPRAGGYCLTLPVQKGDECLVVFGDMCIDAWWQSGGIQNQIDCRRHDLSDGFAILGCWSQPRVIPHYSTGTAQLRNNDGTAYVELAGDTINIVGSTINIRGGRVNINE